MFSVSSYTHKKLAGADRMMVESIEAFQKECLFPEQYNYCLELLSRKAYTQKELLEKLLRRGAPKELCEEVISRLKDEKLISDRDYREAFVHSRQTYKKQGFHKIRQDLYRKGILLEQSDYDRETELENLSELVRGFLKKQVEPKKILNRLMQKGYRFSEILSAIRETRKDLAEELEQYGGFDYEES